MKRLFILDCTHWLLEDRTHFTHYTGVTRAFFWQSDMGGVIQEVKNVMHNIRTTRALADLRQAPSYTRLSLWSIVGIHSGMLICATVLLISSLEGDNSRGLGWAVSVEANDLFATLLAVARGFEALFLLSWFDIAWQIRCMQF